MSDDLFVLRSSLLTFVLFCAAGCTEEKSASISDRAPSDGAGRMIESARRDASREVRGSADSNTPPAPPVDANAPPPPPLDALMRSDLASSGDRAFFDSRVDVEEDRALQRPDAEPPPPPYEATWAPHDLSRVDAYSIPSSAKIFAGQHPAYRMIPEIIALATSNRTIRVSIDVYLIDSRIWTEPEQLMPYFALVSDYFTQARIQLSFTFQEGRAPAWEAARDQLHLYFAYRMMNPRGAIPDGFGNLPAGKAVLNDQLMDRPHVHMNPLFLPGKTIGHEIGHVLGLPHVNPRNFLMAQGTSARNQLDLTAEESVIMRVMALHRFGGEVIDD